MNILDDGMSIWDREIALLLRDEVDTRETAERILRNIVMYMLASMENPGVHIGVGKIVDKGVHQVILDTPVYFAFGDLYNGGKYKHHVPFIKRRREGLVIRTADFLRSCGFSPTRSCGPGRRRLLPVRLEGARLPLTADGPLNPTTTTTEPP